jgi:hypothetical protein
MGFLSQYQDRGPTVREVFEAVSRLRAAMLYDWRRDAAPARAVFTGEEHADALMSALAPADSTCVVLALPTFVQDGGVFALNAETREPVRIGPERIPDLVEAIGCGEAPVSAVVRLASENE